MAEPKRTARQQIERAMHVSFKLPAQAAALLDAHQAEVRADAFDEAIGILRDIPIPPESGDHWHWFDFARNRAIDKLTAARKER
jgi:4-hydroxy-L-threonine phosphate dehydrogenase PdxA